MRFARCCTSDLDFQSSNHFQTTDTGLQISQASKKKLKSSIGHTPLHIVMSCQHYLQERNSFFDIIVNILPVELSVSFFDQSDSEFLTCVLGEFTNWVTDMNDVLWVELMLNVCEYINR